MAIQLVRRPDPGVDPSDAGASRAWILGRVRDEVKRLGQPHPKVYLLGDRFVEWLDLDAMRKREPDANLGLTFQALRRRGSVQRCFLVFDVTGTDPAGGEHHWAVVFEERDTADGRRWWMAMLGYGTDPATGFGVPEAAWQQAPDETGDPAALPAFVHEIVAPPPGARAVEVVEAPDLWQPDVKLAFGELLEGVPAPGDVKDMLELAASLAVGGLLTGKLVGSVVVRVTGRAWEMWVLAGDMPADMHEMIRWIANHRLPPAEGVALVQLAIRPEDEPPVPGIVVMAEHGGMVMQSWAPVELPEGPGGPRRIPVTHWSPATPVSEAYRWLGVPSKAEIVEPTFD